jgi:L-gulonolactone oxidase
MDWTNWSGTVQYRGLDDVYRPQSLGELQHAVKDAVRRGLKIRAVGSGHSWSQLGLPPQNGALLLTDRLNRVLRTDAARGTATVEGGIKVRDLNEELFRRGLSLANLGDWDGQSIAGAVSTDTHGSGAGLPTLSEFVSAVTLVTADGEVYEVPPEELPAARVSLGLLGVVYSLTLDVRKAIFLRHERTVVRLDEEKHRVPDLVAANRNLEYWFYPYTPYVERIIRNEIPSAKEDRVAYFFRDLKTKLGVRLIESKAKRDPSSLPAFFERVIPGLAADVREGPLHRILPLAATWVDVVRTVTMEYQFAYKHLWEAVSELERSIEVARSRGVYLNIPIHIRFTKKSERSLLSHHVHPITVSFSCSFSTSYPGAHVWLPDLERRLLGLGAKPHWGKAYYTRPEIPVEFERVRAKLDPGGVFSNPQKLYVPDARSGVAAGGGTIAA